MSGKAIAFWPIHRLSIITRDLPYADPNLGIYGMKLLWFENVISGPLSYRGFRETGPRTAPPLSAGLITCQGADFEVICEIMVSNVFTEFPFGNVAYNGLGKKSLPGGGIDVDFSGLSCSKTKSSLVSLHPLIRQFLWIFYGFSGHRKSLEFRDRV